MNNNKALKPKKKIIKVDNGLIGVLENAENGKKPKKVSLRNKYEYWLTEDGLILLQGWARDGLNQEEMAKKIGVTRETFSQWRDRFPTIADTIKKNRDICDTEVENALFKRAKGFSINVRKAIKVRNGQSEHIEYVDEEIYFAPDPVAQIFWLKNRRKDLWRNYEQQEVTISTGPNEMHVTLIDQLKNRKLKEMMNEEPTPTSKEEAKDDPAKQ